MTPMQNGIYFDTHKFAVVKEYYRRFLAQDGNDGYAYLKRLYDSYEAERDEWFRNGTARDRRDFEISQQALYDALNEYLQRKTSAVTSVTQSISLW